jgi:plastocyanin
LSVALVAPASAKTITVTIDNVAYAPKDISARVGDTVVWKNADPFVHTATARDKSFDIAIAPDKSGSLTLKKAGEFDYYCRFHPNMTGHISVKK